MYTAHKQLKEHFENTLDLNTKKKPVEYLYWDWVMW